MFFKNYYLVINILCVFIYLCVEAKPNRDETSFGNNKKARSAADYQAQTPLLNNQPPLISEDWIADNNWPVKKNLRMGQVTGVSINSKGEIVVFHRGDHVWNSQSFDHLNVYSKKSTEDPIKDPTVLAFHPETGELLHQWGENIFYLPHGITIDTDDNMWLTDVALHQVFKFPPIYKNSSIPLLALGEPFVPGNSADRFCKPTSVAVTPCGDFFVADGYCNSRLIKYNKLGEKIMEIGHAPVAFNTMAQDPYSYFIPHALTLAEGSSLICVADREHGRVICYDVNNGTYIYQMSSPQIGSLIFSVTYSPQNGGLFFVVNGQERNMYNSVPVKGYTISASNFRLLSYFGPDLKTPHDIAVTEDAKHIFVVEIGPNAVHKYTHNGPLGPAASSLVTKQEIPQEHHSAQTSPQALSLTSPQGTVLPAVIVTCAAITFGAAFVIAALVYSRAKRKGTSTAHQAFYEETEKLVEEDEV